MTALHLGPTGNAAAEYDRHTSARGLAAMSMIRFPWTSVVGVDAAAPVDEHTSTAVQRTEMAITLRIRPLSALPAIAGAPRRDTRPCLLASEHRQSEGARRR